MNNSQTTEQPKGLIDALNTTFGRHAGYRASHAKGGGAVVGRFIPAPDRGALDIPLLDQPRAIRGRFSIGGGKPGISDKSPTVRGLGLAIAGDGESWVLALTSNPVFFANSAEQFRAFLAARVPDPALGGPNPERVKAFNAANPNTVPHQAYLAATSPCRCYTQEAYHSAHAYGFKTREGKVVYGRIVLRPVGGRVGLTADELAMTGDTFLFDRLAQRLAQGPAFWTLAVIMAEGQDAIDDPTAPWGDLRDEQVLGQIEVSAVQAPDLPQVFDPSALAKGVLEPQDQVFALRSAAYAESYARRAGTDHSQPGTAIRA